MKTLILSLLSIVTFAQTQLPDSILLVDGRTTQCLITIIDDSRIYFIYNDNLDESIIVKALSAVYLDGYGEVYSKNSGFTKEIDELNSYVQYRLKKIKDEQDVKAELKRVELEKNKSQVSQDAIENISFQPSGWPISVNKNYNKWSFGVLYVPYYSGNMYNIIYTGSNPYNHELYVTGVNQINLEAQLAYAVLPQLRLTFDAGYSASITENNSESHYRDLNSTYQSDQGYEMISGLKVLDFNIGAEYYFQNIISNKVSVYALFGFGKQIAFAQEKRTQLFVIPDPAVVSENNQEEFNEDINSPWHFNFGFGAEYFFNESLSLTSNIRVLYASHYGKYEGREINTYQSQSYKREYKLKEFVTKIGLGLNFYF